jgi:hydroxypyruvate reductase
VTLLLSDVLGNDVRIIASGPTVEPATTGAAALAVLDLYGLRDSVTPAVRSALNEAALEESEWDYPDDIVEIVGDLDLAMSEADAVSSAVGVASTTVDFLLDGEASEMAREWVEVLLETPTEIDVVWGGGENTVTVRGTGAGGRNTEFALAAALELDRFGNDEWVIASLATDGQDGTSGSAGAIASRASIVRACELDIDPEAALANNDSATFFSQVGGLVITGPSGTNVNDLYVGMRRQSPIA